MKKIVINILIVLPVLAGYSQELKLTYKEAVRIALENNINLKQAENTLGGIEADRRAAYASLAPDLTGYLQGWRSDGNFFLQQTGEVVNTVTNNLYGSFDADIVIFNGLNRQNNIKQTGNILNAQTALIRRSEQDVISLVSSQYLLVLQDEEQININDQ